MADSASAEKVAAAIRPPDFRGAAKLIRSIKAKKDKLASVQGEIGDIWGKVEGLKVNKTAGKFFAKLDALEPAERLDIIRSFNGLADASGWEAQYEDLVDKSEGTVVDMRLGDGRQEEPAEEPDAEGPKPARGMSEAIERSRKHLGTAAPDAEDETDGVRMHS